MCRWVILCAWRGGLLELFGGILRGLVGQYVFVQLHELHCWIVRGGRRERVLAVCGGQLPTECELWLLRHVRLWVLLLLKRPLCGDSVYRGELLRWWRLHKRGVRGGNVLNGLDELMLEMRRWLLPGEPEVRLVHGLRDHHVLCVDGHVCSDGLPRGELLLWRIKRDGHLRRGQVLRYLGGRLHELRHGHLPGDRRLRVLCELRVWDVLHCDGPSRGVGVSGREPVRGRRRGPGLVPVGVILRELFERVFELRGRHVPGIGGCGGVLGLRGRVLLRLDRPHGRERRVRSWSLLCIFGEQLHELLGQHVLGRGGLGRLLGLRERAVLTRRSAPLASTRC